MSKHDSQIRIIIVLNAIGTNEVGNGHTQGEIDRSANN